MMPYEQQQDIFERKLDIAKQASGKEWVNHIGHELDMIAKPTRNNQNL